MRTKWGTWFRVLRPKARAVALEKWGYATPHEAIEAGNMEALKFLLDKQASVVERVHGETAVQVAIRKRNFEALRWVVKCGAYVNTRDLNGDTLLGVAARDGDLELAGVLLELGARTHFRNKAGYSPIMWSAVKGNVPMTRLLLEKGASANVPPWVWEKYWKSPLTEAVFGGNLEVVKMLVEAGARLYDKDQLGRSPIDLAKARARAQAERLAGSAYIFPVRKHGSLSSLRSNEEQKHHSAGAEGGSFNSDYVAGGDIDSQANATRGERAAIVSFLAEKTRDCEEPDAHGDTPLLRAVKEGDEAGVCCLLGRGADVHAKDREGQTSLVCAARGRNLRMVKVLLENSLEAKLGIDESDRRGRTALMYAARDGDLEMVKFLVGMGANLNVKSKINGVVYIVSWAKRKKKLPITQYRRSARVETSSEVGFTALTYAAKRGHTEIVEFLLERGADANVRDCYERTVLMQALIGKYCKLEIIKLLIKHGADIHARDLDGASAIHFASIHGKTSVIAYLLEHGADANDMNNQWFTPLMQLSVRGAINTISFLIGHGADIDMMEEFGRTALWFAVKSKRKNVVKFLLERGAKADVMDEYTQKTALTLAREAGREDIAELLRRYGAKGFGNVVPSSS